MLVKLFLLENDIFRFGREENLEDLEGRKASGSGPNLLLL